MPWCGQLFARSWSRIRVEGSGGAVTSHTKRNNNATPICSGKRVYPRAEQRCPACSRCRRDVTFWLSTKTPHKTEGTPACTAARYTAEGGSAVEWVGVPCPMPRPVFDCATAQVARTDNAAGCAMHPSPVAGWPGGNGPSARCRCRSCDILLAGIDARVTGG